MLHKWILKYFLVILIITLLSLNAFAEDTPPQVPVGIAVGPNSTIEVSFPDMSNSQGCDFNRAFMIASDLDTDTKDKMIALLLTAKVTNTPVRVRLDGCYDRPRIVYVFYDVDWLY